MYVLACDVGKAHALHSLFRSKCGQSMWEYSVSKNHVSNTQAKSLHNIPDITVLLLTVNLGSCPETETRFCCNTVFSLLIPKYFLFDG